MTDSEHLDRGDIWSNKEGWQSREGAGRSMCRQMLPGYRAIWAHYHPGEEISDDALIDYVMNLSLSPMHMVFGG